MSRLKPFFSYFGSKHRLAPKYPAPLFETVVEPFAGSACYSLLHHEKSVRLYDINPRVVSTWEYLIRVSPEEVLALPDLRADQTVDDLAVCQEARFFIGWWCNAATTEPRKRLSKNALSATTRQLVWSARVRERVARQVPLIRHWKIENSSFECIENREATWFIDPPYQQAGIQYTFGSKLIDYAALGSYCKSRVGQVIVCEGSYATWLPFEPFASCSSAVLDAGRSRLTKELIYTRGSP